MQNNKSSLRSLCAIAVFASLGLVACGGGGGGGGGTPPPTVTALSGTVTAPGGSLAQLENKSLMDRMLALLIPSATAQSGSLQPVNGADVLVFRINDDGTVNGGVIVQTTTDSNGAYSVNLPAGTSLGSNLIVQVGSGATPQPVGGTGGGQLNCPATQPTLDIDPVAEYVTRLLIAAATTLPNFTNAEVNALIARAEALAQDPSLVGADIETTLQNIAGIADPEITQLVASAEAAGEATAPSGLGGTYNLVAFYADDNGSAGELEQETGTVTINVSAKTFAVNSSIKSASLAGSCTADSSNPCATTFTRSSDSGTDSTSGSITLFAGNQIAFQPSDGEGAVGSFNAAGDMVVIPTGDGLILLIKQPTSAPGVEGNYQAAELIQSLPSNVSVASGTPYNLGESSNALTTVSVTSGTLSGSATTSKMTKEITCNSTAPSTCSQTEVLTTASQSDSFTADVSTDSAGKLTIAGGPSGMVSSDGNLFVLANGDPVNDGDGGLVIALKEASNMPTTGLDGDYNFSGLEFALGGGSRSLISSAGTITLDSTNGVSGNLVTFQHSTNSSCGSGLCPNSSTSESSRTETFTTTYTVDPNGVVTVAGDPGTTISGYASADGKIVVLTETQDGTIGQQTGSDSFRGLFVLTRQ